MPQAVWSRQLLRRMSEEYELSRGTRNKQDGEVIWEFTTPETIYGLLRPPSAAYSEADVDEWSIGESGEEIKTQYILDVLEVGERSSDTTRLEKYIVDPPIETGDRIITRHGNFRIVDSAFIHHDGFGRYALVDDSRGDSSGGSGSDPPYEIA